MITLNSSTGFSPAELALLQKAIAQVNTLFASEEFAQEVMSITDFSDTTDTPAQIVAKLQQTLSIDFFIFDPTFWQRHFSKEIAFEDSQGVHFMRSKFDAESFAEVCNTVAHESCHSAGYTHPYNPSVERDDSVPYQIGQLVETLVTG